MKLGVLRQRLPGERRVAVIPAHIGQLSKLGLEVLVEAGAGKSSGYDDVDYSNKGARVVGSIAEVFEADLIASIRLAGANRRPDGQVAPDDEPLPWQARHIAIGLADPLGEPQSAVHFASQGATLLALELIPRITRAQSMDVLSSQSTVTGYRAAILAAYELPRMLPLLMTAAGTIKAAQVLVLGAGVAGLQAMATMKKLGAVVSGYDIRPACREQIESLGARFVDLQLETESAEGQGGYARVMDEAFYQQQRQRLAEFVGRSDAVICTAAIPGKRSPLLVTSGAVAKMAPGSVIVDLAAERGGNCELTLADRRVEQGGVTILGPTNLAAKAPFHASQMFSANVTRYLANLVQDGAVRWDMKDEILRETLVAREGQIVHAQLRELLKLEPLSPSVPWSP